MKKQLVHTFEEIVSFENLCAAWEEFVRGKRSKPDVQYFARDLPENLAALHHELVSKTYCHGPYVRFTINDPKPRIIHKATVRDRVVHHAVHRILYPFFDCVFVADSFSCRVGKGVHAALNRFRAMAYAASSNHTRTVWVLKCDIRKFFSSIPHAQLTALLKERISDENILWLLERIIGSFSSFAPGVGLPLGNVTSQLLANVYLNELDQLVKHRLHEHRYLRYADDFIILSPDHERLMSLVPQINLFLHERLALNLHKDKLFLKTAASGVDFLGWVHFSRHRVLRAVTRRRILARIAGQPSIPTMRSYIGLTRHGNTSRLSRKLWRTFGRINR